MQRSNQPMRSTRSAVVDLLASRFHLGLILVVAMFAVADSARCEEASEPGAYLLVRFRVATEADTTIIDGQLPQHGPAYMELAQREGRYKIVVPAQPTLQRFLVPSGPYYVKQIIAKGFGTSPTLREPKDTLEMLSVPSGCAVYIGDFYVDDSGLHVTFPKESLAEVNAMTDLHAYPLRISRFRAPVVRRNWE